MSEQSGSTILTIQRIACAMALLTALGDILNSVYRTGSALADSKRRQTFWKKEPHGEIRRAALREGDCLPYAKPSVAKVG
jgi:hypothetical protein